MSADVCCECGTILETSTGRLAGTRWCPNCGNLFAARSPGKPWLTWTWVGLISVSLAGIAGALFMAVEKAREAVARAH